MTDMDVGVVGSHVARLTADLALQGEYTHARAISLGTQKMLHGQRYAGRRRKGGRKEGKTGKQMRLRMGRRQECGEQRVRLTETQEDGLQRVDR